MLLLVTSRASSQDHPQMPDGFTYIGPGNVEGTDRLVMTSPTSAVLLSIVPDGREVRQGDLIATIDDTRLNSALTRQQTATKQAADTWKLASDQLKIARELAAIELEIAAETVRLAELDREQQLGENGTHDQLVARAKHDGQVARIERDLLTTYLKQLERSSSVDHENITESKVKLISVESALRQAEMELERLSGPARSHLQAELDLAVLRAKANKLKVTRDQQNLQRTSETNTLNRKNILETLTNKLKELEEQIAQCQIFAPNDGIIQYVEPGLAKGLPLRSKQILFAIVNTGTLSVTAIVDEGPLRRIEIGQPATIRFKTNPKVYQAYVKEVAPTIPGGRARNLASYAVTVELKPPHDEVRVGMRAYIGVELND